MSGTTLRGIELSQRSIVVLRFALLFHALAGRQTTAPRSTSARFRGTRLRRAAAPA